MAEAIQKTNNFTKLSYVWIATLATQARDDGVANPSVTPPLLRVWSASLHSAQ